MMPETRTRITRCTALLTMIAALAICIVPVSALTITDDAGAMITLDTTPERIVSLSPSNTEILAALGLPDRVVGITDVCDYPPEVQNKTRIGGYSAISIEKVAAARPDLIIASDLTPKETVSRLGEIGLPVVVVAPKNIDHVIQDIRLVGEITGTGPQAEELAANLSRRIAAAQPESEPGFRPTVAHVVWHKPLYVSGNNTLQNDVISNDGGVNVFADRSGWSTVSLEEFLLTNPDIIIVSGGGGMDSSEKDVILEEFMTNPQYASLSAVKNHHVYAVNADIISRPGPRIADAAEEVSRIISAIAEEHTAQIPVAADAGNAKAPGFSAGAMALALFGICLAMRK
jgi:iron complex transport system substrate-binding protein